jgi:dipicolinate synthase subunit A
VGKTNLENCMILIAGGDAREITLADELAAAGADVRLLGFDKPAYVSKSSYPAVMPVTADAIICPLPGIDTAGNIFAPFSEKKIGLVDLKSLFVPGLIFICGKISEQQCETLRSMGVRVVVTAEMDELAIYNAVPTAEGAVELAMRESVITIHGSQAVVIGFGRCGLPLARTLQGLGAEVTVVARRPEVLAQAHVLGFRTIPVELLDQAVPAADFIFNTVPAPILGGNILVKARQDAVIVDIASAPGGTDFEAAKRLGLKSFLSPGLPGKVAPVSAGKILAKVYLNILSLMGKGGKTVET